jgi:hypothetical protein
VIVLIRGSTGGSGIGIQPRNEACPSRKDFKAPH